MISNVTEELRQRFAGALYFADQEVRSNILIFTYFFIGIMTLNLIKIKATVEAMNNTGLLDNSLIVVASDNGGNPDKGGNNWPLRGTKKTMFEGGIRVPGIHELLPNHSLCIWMSCL